MDWSKAKTILIAVFLAINIFLAYMIIGADYGSIGYVDSEKVQHVTEYLESKNIAITGTIPLKKNDMSSIIVKYRLFSKEAAAEKLFPSGKYTVGIGEGNYTKLFDENIEAGIKDNREFTYANKEIKPATEINEKACIKNIKAFLAGLGLKDDANIRMGESLDGYKRFVYSQSFKGFIIYNSRMEFFVNDSGIYKARIEWFDTVKQAGKRADVISPIVALLSLPEYYKDNNGEKIEVLEVQQGYYFGTGASGQVDVSKVEQGTAFPVWKITTNKDIFYINAYNEKVEGVEKRQ